MGVNRKVRAASLSVASNTLLVIAKLTIGLLSGSISIISEAIHSANDLVAAVIAWFAVRISDRPPDKDHPYGHGKVEGISGWIEAGLIIVAAAMIIREAIQRLLHGSEVQMLGVGAAVMAGSAVLNIIVSRYLFRVAKEEESLALEADAQHLATDVYTSAGVAFGLFLVWLTDWHPLDPIVAILVALFIARVGWQLTRRATGHLMDQQILPAEQRQIEAVLNQDGRVVSWHDLRTRMSGARREIDVHIVVRRDSSLIEAHEIADDMERRIAALFPSANVVIHTDPWDDSQPETVHKRG